MKEHNMLLITGGMGDIGTAIAKSVSTRYKHVIALDIAGDEDVADWLQKLRAQDYNNIEFRRMDVASYEDCERVIGELQKEYGPIQALINNAGITRDAVFTKMTKQQWDAVLRVNLDGMFNVTKQVVEDMREQAFGRIINISSVNALKGQFSQANYAASKSGVYGFTKSLAQELMSKNITVNAISPGYVNTRLMQGIRPDILDSIIADIPARRLARPDEIAHAVRFLLDDNSGYITGSNLSINGGLYMN